MNKVFEFIKSKSTPWKLSWLAGFLVGTTYIPSYPWALLFCYAPLWIAVQKLLSDSTLSRKALFIRVFGVGWLTQFVLTLIGFNWIYYVASEFGQLHWSLSAGALFLFAAFMHIYIPLSLVVGCWIIQRWKIQATWLRFFIFAVSLALLERLWPSIFEWNLAYTLLWAKIPLYQWADTVGFWGLSTWILIFQAFITEAIFSWRQNRQQAIEILTAVATVIVVLTGVGILKHHNWTSTNQTIQWGVAQGNIGNMEKIQSEQQGQFHSYISNIYTQLTAQHLKAHPETELMIWPETSLPFALDPLFLNNLVQRQLLNNIKQWNIPLITGSYSVDLNTRDHLGNPLTSNSVFFLGTDFKSIAEPYNKTDLLVFGEYMPLGKQFPILYQWLPFVGIFKEGPGPSVRELTLTNKTLRVGPQICYESLNPGFSRGLAKKGAQIIFNVTNDSWFGWWGEPFQHQIMTLARAIEVRRPLVRATNTGITSAILANGDLLENSPINKSWAHTYEVSYLENPPQTFYTRFGYLDFVVWILITFGLIYYYRGKNHHVRH